MYAIIETGGKQYRVENGDIIRIEKLGAEIGDTVEFDNVLVIGSGDDIHIGTPYVDGQKVTGEVVAQGKADKVIIFKYLAKKDHRKKQGHRQPYTEVKINGLGGTAKDTAKAPKTEKVDSSDNNIKKKNVSASMKKDELIEYAQEHNIEIDKKATKAVIIETIEAASK